MAQDKPNTINNKRRFNIERVARLEILAPLYKRGFSFRQIQAEVMSRLNLKSYSLATVKHDIEFLLKEWRDERISDVDANIQLELQRIDQLVQEAWEAWDKSKEDYQKQRAKQVAVPKVEGEGGESADGEQGVDVIKMEQSREDMRSCGDPRYIDTINKLLVERRKILGLYAPEKKELSCDLTFADFLMKTGQKK